MLSRDSDVPMVIPDALSISRTENSTEGGRGRVQPWLLAKRDTQLVSNLKAEPSAPGGLEEDGIAGISCL